MSKEVMNTINTIKQKWSTRLTLRILQISRNKKKPTGLDFTLDLLTLHFFSYIQVT